MKRILITLIFFCTINCIYAQNIESINDVRCNILHYAGENNIPQDKIAHTLYWGRNDGYWAYMQNMKQHIKEYNPKGGELFTSIGNEQVDNWFKNSFCKNGWSGGWSDKEKALTQPVYKEVFMAEFSTLYNVDAAGQLKDNNTANAIEERIQGKVQSWEEIGSHNYFQQLAAVPQHIRRLTGDIIIRAQELAQAAVIRTSPNFPNRLDEETFYRQDIGLLINLDYYAVIEPMIRNRTRISGEELRSLRATLMPIFTTAYQDKLRDFFNREEQQDL